MPLLIKTYHPQQKVWIPIGRIEPNDRPGTMSNNQKDGTRQALVFFCHPDDSKSVIATVPPNKEIIFGELRALDITNQKLKVIAKIARGESRDFSIITDLSPQPKLIRFEHE